MSVPNPSPRGSLLFVVLCSFLVATTATPQPRNGSSVDEIVRSLQRKYDATRDFSASFVQTYEGGVLRQKTSERGEVFVKKPGKMRWTYTSPEAKVFVSDGRQMFAYVPADRQVVVSDVPEGDLATTPLQFLVGRGDMTRDFTASLVELPEAPAESYAIKFVPKKREPEYDWLIMVVDRSTLQLRMLQSIDSQGGTSTFLFTNLKENVGLPDSAFIFKIPRGTDVITRS